MTDISQAEVPSAHDSPPPPQTNGIAPPLTAAELEELAEERSRIRPADIDADVREMERRKRVELIMNSRLFREELERIIEVQMREGNGSSSGLMQQISDMMGVGGGGGGSAKGGGAGVFKNSNCVVPINDIRGIEAMGYAKGEKILRCKLAAVYRLIDLYGWTQSPTGAGNLITARLNQDDQHFLANPSGLLYHEITASSLIRADIRGNVLEQGTANFPLDLAAYALHAAVHAARPDIRCVIRVRTAAVVAVSAVRSGLMPLCEEAAVVGEVTRWTGGVSVMDDDEEKDRIARSLGPNSKVMLLTNQGAICCGETIEEAFFNARNTVLACDAQLKLLPLGVENLLMLDEETRQRLYESAHRPPDSSPRPDQPAVLAETAKVVERKWRVGGVEFEALMRMLDNAGFRTGYIYRQPLVRGEVPRPRNDVEVPPAVSSLGYLLEEEEFYKQGLWKKLEGGRKGHDRSRWLNSPNVYQKVEILETGTPDPKKITKWVTDGSPTHSSTPVKIEGALQFVPKNTNPKEFKVLQQQLKDYRRADKISAGPQSHILEGVTWEEARKMQDAGVTQTGDHVVLMGAASKGIIQRGYQHNATMYKAPYAKNPFDCITDEELDEYKKDVEKKKRGEYDTDYSESEGLSSANINKRVSDIRSPTSETEEESRDEPQVLRIETKHAPKPSQPEVVLSDGQSAVRALVKSPGRGSSSYGYRSNSYAGLPKGSYTTPNPTHFHITRCCYTCAVQKRRATLVNVNTTRKNDSFSAVAYLRRRQTMGETERQTMGETTRETERATTGETMWQIPNIYLNIGDNPPPINQSGVDFYLDIFRRYIDPLPNDLDITKTRRIFGGGRPIRSQSNTIRSQSRPIETQSNTIESQNNTIDSQSKTIASQTVNNSIGSQTSYLAATLNPTKVTVEDLSDLSEYEVEIMTSLRSNLLNDLTLNNNSSNTSSSSQVAGCSNEHSYEYIEVMNETGKTNTGEQPKNEEAVYEDLEMNTEEAKNEETIYEDLEMNDENAEERVVTSLFGDDGSSNDWIDVDSCGTSGGESSSSDSSIDEDSSDSDNFNSGVNYTSENNYNVELEVSRRQQHQLLGGGSPVSDEADAVAPTTVATVDGLNHFYRNSLIGDSLSRSIREDYDYLPLNHRDRYLHYALPMEDVPEIDVVPEEVEVPEIDLLRFAPHHDKLKAIHDEFFDTFLLNLDTAEVECYRFIELLNSVDHWRLRKLTHVRLLRRFVKAVERMGYFLMGYTAGDDDMMETWRSRLFGDLPDGKVICCMNNSDTLRFVITKGELKHRHVFIDDHNRDVFFSTISKTARGHILHALAQIRSKLNEVDVDVDANNAKLVSDIKKSIETIKKELIEIEYCESDFSVDKQMTEVTKSVKWLTKTSKIMPLLILSYHYASDGRFPLYEACANLQTTIDMFRLLDIKSKAEFLTSVDKVCQYISDFRLSFCVTEVESYISRFGKVGGYYYVTKPVKGDSMIRKEDFEWYLKCWEAPEGSVVVKEEDISDYCDYLNDAHPWIFEIEANQACRYNDLIDRIYYHYLIANLEYNEYAVLSVDDSFNRAQITALPNDFEFELSEMFKSQPFKELTTTNKKLSVVTVEEHRLWENATTDEKLQSLVDRFDAELVFDNMSNPCSYEYAVSVIQESLPAVAISASVKPDNDTSSRNEEATQSDDFDEGLGNSLNATKVSSPNKDLSASSSESFDEITRELSNIILSFVKEQSYEIEELILFPDIMYNEQADKLFIQLLDCYKNNVCVDYSPEERNELRIDISGYILKQLESCELKASGGSASPDSTTMMVSDKVFSITEFVSDILDSFFDQLLLADDFVKTDAKAHSQTPENGGGCVVDFDEMVTSFQIQKLKSGSERFWVSIHKTPTKASPDPNPANVVNVDEIPLRPPPDFHVNNLGESEFKFTVNDAEDLALDRDQDEDDESLSDQRVLAKYTPLPSILEESSRNLFGENSSAYSGEGDDDDEVVVVVANKPTDDFAGGGGDYIAFDRPELNVVVCSEVNFYRTNTVNTTAFIHAAGITFNKERSFSNTPPGDGCKTGCRAEGHLEVIEEADDDGDDEGNWMGFESAMF